MPIEKQIRDRIHALVVAEATQIDNINAKRPRTDSGYTANLDACVSDIISLYEKANSPAK